jgi:hypothetical protein
VTGGYRLARIARGYAHVIREDGSFAGRVEGPYGTWRAFNAEGRYLPQQSRKRRLAVVAVIEADQVRTRG